VFYSFSMEKLMYLLWAAEPAEANHFNRVLLGEVAPRLRELGATKVTIEVDDADSDVPTPVPLPEGELPLIGVVSFWLDCHDRRGPQEAVLRTVGERQAGYLVTESLYTDYGDNEFARARDWPDGARSPGLVMVTLLEKPERLTYEQWIAHWYGKQSPISAELQPRTRYVRNAVARPLTEEAPPYLGIVEECWPSAQHLTDPLLFYNAGGSKRRMRDNMTRMLESVSAFLDLERIRCATMSEYLVGG
jgi:hypothetical protein